MKSLCGNTAVYAIIIIIIIIIIISIVMCEGYVWMWSSVWSYTLK